MERQRTLGFVRAVCVSRRKGERKRPVPRIVLREGHGIVGDAHAGPWKRQVSLLAEESIERMRSVIPGLQDGDFAENIVVSGVSADSFTVGDRLRAGDGVLLEVTQIGKECHEQCAIRAATGDCIMPREGVFCRVLSGGTIRPGDEISRDP